MMNFLKNHPGRMLVLIGVQLAVTVLGYAPYVSAEKPSWEILRISQGHPALEYRWAMDNGDSSYGLSWWTVDGGGATSRSGGYTLEGTSGQPDAAIWRGESYTLYGGFWEGTKGAYRIYLSLLLRNLQ